MSQFRALTGSNDGQYRCTVCGSANVSIIRQDAQNPRCKCGACGFVFNGADSAAAQEAGALPSSSAETLNSTDEANREIEDDRTNTREYVSPRRVVTVVPRQPKYLFITKERKNCVQELVTEKEAKKTILRWEQKESKYEIYELVPKKFDVTVDLG